MKSQLANIITSSRIILAICMLFCPAFSVLFYLLYLLCGVTDMVDGTVARKMKAVSEFGAKLDTVADGVFVAVCLVKILPPIYLPVWLKIWIAAIAVIKIGNILRGFICGKQLISVHSFWNRVTGFLLFLFPLTLDFVELQYSSVPICMVAMLAAIDEWYCVTLETDKRTKRSL